MQMLKLVKEWSVPDMKAMGDVAFGVRCDIGYKKRIEGYARKKRNYEQRKDIEDIRNEVRQQMKEELKSSDFWEEMRAELKAELRNEMKPKHNLFSPREDDVSNSVHMKSSLNSTTIMVRNETQAQQNESFSPRQEGNHRSVQMRSNLSLTKSIKRKEQQGEQNELISTRQVNVPSSVQRTSNLSSTTRIIKKEYQAGEKVACATAMVYPIGDGTVHFKKLLKGHMKQTTTNSSTKNMSSTKLLSLAVETSPMAVVEKEKAANRKSLQALEDESDEFYFAINATGIIELLTYKELECGIVTFLRCHCIILRDTPHRTRVVGSLKWEFLLVNRQPEDWECGYYVMKWMHDFVLKYQNENFPNVKNQYGDQLLRRPFLKERTDVDSSYRDWLDNRFLYVSIMEIPPSESGFKTTLYGIF
nr:ulp1 protease family, C-terminal catalytic domain-containing protein [Tanacetum cinerariifolium]